MNPALVTMLLLGLILAVNHIRESGKEISVKWTGPYLLAC